MNNFSHLYTLKHIKFIYNNLTQEYMYTKKIALCLGLIGSTFLMGNPNKAFAQDIHFTQFNMSPLVVNPAFTGAFNGDFRANVIYRDQWRYGGGDAVFKTYAASFDMPIIKDLSIDDYLSAGLLLYNDVAGDGNLSNFTALASVSYHKFLGNSGNKAIAVGIQGGYVQKSIDLSKLYFGDEFDNGDWAQGTTSEDLFNQSSNYLINAGVAFSHAPSSKFAYVIGVGANNLNQPLETMNRREINNQVGLGMRYTAQFGSIYTINERFSVRPAILFQSQSKASEIVAGNEFHFNLGQAYDYASSPSLFAGVWYRHNDAIMGSVGVEWQNFRLGFSYDYTTSDWGGTNNGNGGFEVALRYIQPSIFASARKFMYPCSRF